MHRIKNIHLIFLCLQQEETQIRLDENKCLNFLVDQNRNPRGLKQRRSTVFNLGRGTLLPATPSVEGSNAEDKFRNLRYVAITETFTITPKLLVFSMGLLHASKQEA